MTKKIFLVLICICGCVFSAYSQDKPVNVASLQKKIETLSIGQSKLNSEIQRIANDANKTKSSVQSIKRQNDELKNEVDSLNKVTISLAEKQSADKDSLDGQIKTTNTHLASNQSALSNRTIWGVTLIVIVVLLLIFAFILISRKMKKGETSMESTIDGVRRTQETLQNAQKQLQEDSVKLDNELLKIAQAQIAKDNKENPTGNNGVKDHSLALKVADEIARIEMNMSRMDSSVKGYKQLQKAVERIKDNYKANGYEIADMLNKPYNEGMRVNADFVIDEDLKPGERIITGVTKPQVLYNGELIQKATIKVSQNI